MGGEFLFLVLKNVVLGQVIALFLKAVGLRLSNQSLNFNGILELLGIFLLDEGIALLHRVSRV